LLWINLATSSDEDDDYTDTSLDLDVLQKLKRVYGKDVRNQFDLCASESTRCEFAEIAEQVAFVSYRIREGLIACPTCDYPSYWCKDFWRITVYELGQTVEACEAAKNWPPSCGTMLVMLQTSIAQPSFDVTFLCNIISPPDVSVTGTTSAAPHVLPTCRDLVDVTMTWTPTMRHCKDYGKEQCVNHFCKVYETFRWRMRPRNLQESVSPNLYPEDFLLSGCEVYEQHGFLVDACPRRRDIMAMCDCLCEELNEGPLVVTTRNALQAIQNPPVENIDCAFNVDAYLLFGRLGAGEVQLHPSCERQLCELFDERRRSQPQCKYAEIPDFVQCTAMTLSEIKDGQIACPWLQPNFDEMDSFSGLSLSSGEMDTLQCMDGHRCSIMNDSWGCCQFRRGRGQCPLELPVMCDTLCSGTTEYCCGKTNSCVTRGCSPILLHFFVYEAVGANTTLAPTTLRPGLPSKKESFWDNFQISLNFDLAGLLLLWLALIVPCCCAICVFANWEKVMRLQESLEPPHRDDPKLKLEDHSDKIGRFSVIKRPPPDDVGRKRRELVRIMVKELPEKKPLGLELQELMVIRVHGGGAKWGWQEGDLILEIGGVRVECFEDLWERIKIERGRGHPVAFLVERLGRENVDPDAAAVAAPVAKTERKGSRRKPSRVSHLSSSGVDSSSPTSSRNPTNSRLPTMSRLATLSQTDADSWTGTPSRMGTTSRMGTRTEAPERPTTFRSLRNTGHTSAAEAALALMDDVAFDAKDGIACARSTAPEARLCTACRKEIHGPSVQVARDDTPMLQGTFEVAEVLTDPFHPECFCCVSCRTPIEGNYLRSEDMPGYLCTDCRPRCHYCNESFVGTKARSLKVENYRFHVGCFRCCDCQEELTMEYVKVDEAAYQCPRCQAIVAAANGDPPPGQLRPQFATTAEILSDQLSGPEPPSPSEIQGSSRSPSRTKKREEPEWAKRLPRKSRKDEVFPIIEDAGQKLKDLVGNNKGPSRKEVRWVRDAWGRQVMTVLD